MTPTRFVKNLALDFESLVIRALGVPYRGQEFAKVEVRSAFRHGINACNNVIDLDRYRFRELKPEVFLCDKPFAYGDSQTIQRRISQEPIIIFSTNDSRGLRRNANRVVQVVVTLNGTTNLGDQVRLAFLECVQQFGPGVEYHWLKLQPQDIGERLQDHDAGASNFAVVIDVLERLEIGSWINGTEPKARGKAKPKVTPVGLGCNPGGVQVLAAL